MSVWSRVVLYMCVLILFYRRYQQYTPNQPPIHQIQAKECGFWDDDAIFLPLASERIGPAKSITLVVRSVLAHGGNRPVACMNAAGCFVRTRHHISSSPLDSLLFFST